MQFVIRKGLDQSPDDLCNGIGMKESRLSTGIEDFFHVDAPDRNSPGLLTKASASISPLASTYIVLKILPIVDRWRRVIYQSMGLNGTEANHQIMTAT